MVQGHPGRDRSGIRAIPIRCPRPRCQHGPRGKTEAGAGEFLCQTLRMRSRRKKSTDCGTIFRSITQIFPLA